MRTILILTAVLAVAAVASGAAPGKVEYINFDEAKIAVTTENPTCLYDAPNDEEDSVMCFPEGSELTLIGKIKKKVEVEGKEGYWYKVDLGTGDDYYVFGSYIEFVKSNTNK